MAVNDYYARGVLDWTDQPSCVDATIRGLAIQLNDWCATDAEREALIGPHVWTTMGTASAALSVERVNRTVQFAMDNAAELLDRAGVDHDFRALRGDQFYLVRIAARSVWEDLHARLWKNNAYQDAYFVAGRVEYAASFAAGATSAERRALVGSEAARVCLRYYKGNNRLAGQRRLLDFILELCAMGTPTEVDCAVTKEETLRVVCGVQAGA